MTGDSPICIPEAAEKHVKRDACAAKITVHETSAGHGRQMCSEKGWYRDFDFDRPLHVCRGFFYGTTREMYFPPCGGHGPVGGRGRRGRLYSIDMVRSMCFSAMGGQKPVNESADRSIDQDKNALSGIRV